MKRSNLRIAGIFTVIAVLSLVVVINVFVVTIGGVHMRSGTNILASKEGSQERQETLPDIFVTAMAVSSLRIKIHIQLKLYFLKIVQVLMLMLTTRSLRLQPWLLF